MKVVSPRVRTLVLLLVLFAILYVLISPLPEMSATKSVQPFVLALAFLLIVLITEVMAAFFPNGQPSRLDVNWDLQAMHCSRLC